jgi:large subunit ribosomal protein L5
MAASMTDLRLGKLVLNIGVGKSGEPLEKASRVLGELTGRKPSVRRAKKTVRDFGIHRREPIGVMVTLRGKDAHSLVDRLITAKEGKLNESAFDPHGSCSFGIKEHIDIPGIKYDPEIGIIGLNVSLLMEKPGFRVGRRRRQRASVGLHQRVKREEAMQFMKDTFKVEVLQA